MVINSRFYFTCTRLVAHVDMASAIYCLIDKTFFKWRRSYYRFISVLCISQISVQEDSEGEGLVAHFPAHTSEPIASMAFDPSGKYETERIFRIEQKKN